MTDLKLCALADVKLVAPVSMAWTGADSQTEEHIKIASQLVMAHCRRAFTPITGWADYSGTPDRGFKDLGRQDIVPFNVRLKQPKVDPTSFKAYLSYSFGWTDDDLLIGTTTDGSAPDYLLDTTNDYGAVFTLLAPTSYHERSLKLVYNSGYTFDLTDTDLLLVDPLVRRATALQTAFTLNRIADNEQGTTQAEAGGSRRRKVFTPLTATGLFSEVAALLRDWRVSPTPSM